MDWDSAACTKDPRRAYDALRDRCPVAKRPSGGTWIITGHAEVRACALDASAFSNQVSSHLQIPNGLDGDLHRRFRTLVDGFLAPSRIAAIEPCFRKIASEFVEGLPRGVPVGAVWQIGAPLAVRFQCAWLGWPLQLEATLLRWMTEYCAAMRDNDPARRARVAAHFEVIVVGQLRRRKNTGTNAPAVDVTTELLHSVVEDPSAPGGRRPLNELETVSILRNWTAGDLGTVAACVGAVAQRVATDADLQRSLRARLDESAVLERTVDECLLIDDPFLWNRRTATKDVELAGCLIPAGAQILLNWTTANRDPRCFGFPDEFRPDDNAPHNLVYGAVPHACPGRGLATLQPRETFVALLRSTSAIRHAGQAPIRATAPTGGYDQVWLVLN